MTRQPLEKFPAEAAPISEWARPLSARCGRLETNYELIESENQESEKEKSSPRRGASRQRNPKTKFNEGQIKELFAKGMSGAEIAEYLGVGRGSISRVLKRLGLRREP